MNNASTIKTYIFITVFAAGMSACDGDSNRAEVQTFYYIFAGFDSSAITAELPERVKDEFLQHDYLITHNERLLSIERDKWIHKDSLHFFHPVVHRCVIVYDGTRPEEGSMVIEVTAAATPGRKIPVFGYKRYSYTRSEGLILQYDFGFHHAIGVHTDMMLEYSSFLAEEFARASFK
jgi:hypothetical protein